MDGYRSLFSIPRSLIHLAFQFPLLHMDFRPSTQTHPTPPPSFPSIPSLPHKLQQIVRRPSRLRKAQAALNALQELSRDLVAHDMRLALIALVEFFARGPFVDADHGDADGPGSVGGKEKGG